MRATPTILIRFTTIFTAITRQQLLAKRLQMILVVAMIQVIQVIQVIQPIQTTMAVIHLPMIKRQLINL